jgi:hypothetical protein
MQRTQQRQAGDWICGGKFECPPLRFFRRLRPAGGQLFAFGEERLAIETLRFFFRIFPGPSGSNRRVIFPAGTFAVARCKSGRLFGWAFRTLGKNHGSNSNSGDNRNTCNNNSTDSRMDKMHRLMNALNSPVLGRKFSEILNFPVPNLSVGPVPFLRLDLKGIPL